MQFLCPHSYTRGQRHRASAKQIQAVLIVTLYYLQLLSRYMWSWLESSFSNFRLVGHEPHNHLEESRMSLSPPPPSPAHSNLSEILNISVTFFQNYSGQTFEIVNLVSHFSFMLTVFNHTGSNFPHFIWLINSNMLPERESCFQGNRRGNVWTTQWHV